MSENTQIKPCPFCGSKHVSIYRTCILSVTLYEVTCNECGATSGSNTGQEETIASWNSVRRGE